MMIVARCRRPDRFASTICARAPEAQEGEATKCACTQQQQHAGSNKHTRWGCATAAGRAHPRRTLVSSGRRKIKGVDRSGDPDDVAWRKKSAHTSHGSVRAGALACLKNYGIERLRSRGETHHGALAHPWLPRPARRCRRLLSQHRVRVRVPACPPYLVLEREQLESQRRW